MPRSCKCLPDPGQAVEVKVSLLSYSLDPSVLLLGPSVLLRVQVLPQQGWQRLGLLCLPAHRFSEISTEGKASNRDSASGKSFPSWFFVASSASVFVLFFLVARPLDQFLHHPHLSFLWTSYSHSPLAQNETTLGTARSSSLGPTESSLQAAPNQGVKPKHLKATARVKGISHFLFRTGKQLNSCVGLSSEQQESLEPPQLQQNNNARTCK